MSRPSLALTRRRLERLEQQIRQSPDPELRHLRLTDVHARQHRLQLAEAEQRHAREVARAARDNAAAAFLRLESLGVSADQDGLLQALEAPPGSVTAETARTLVASLESLRRALRRAHKATLVSQLCTTSLDR